MFGNSYGGYLANLCAKIAPWSIDFILDNSSFVNLFGNIFRLIGFGKVKFISIFLEKNMEFLKDYIDLIIFLILGIMAFIAFWCVVERMLFFRKINFKNYENQEQFDDAISENLTTIYIIYSNAPYIGLLGTVIGIMVTFYEMGLAGNIDVKSIVVGLSLALKATALGLLVAIPALMAYNALLRKVSLLSNAYKANKNA